MTNVTAGYDQWSKTYDAFDNPMIAMVDWVLNHHPLKISGQHVLELGCGTGRNVARIFACGAANYTGIDGSDGMLEQARRRALSSPASWLKGDLNESLPVAASSVNAVLVTLVYEHLAQLEPSIAEVARVLTPGGRLRILEIHPGLVERGTQAHFWVGDQEIRLPSFRHDATEFTKAVETAGLKLEAVNEWAAPTELVAKMPKLAKHEGRPMLIEVVAVKPLIGI